MKTKNFFVAKFVAVTLALGFFSPSIDIQKIEKFDRAATAITMDMPGGILANLTTSEITFTLFTQAEAKKKYKKHRKKARRKARRRANYRHHRHHNYRDRRDDHRRDVAGALLIGGVVGAALNEASQD